MKKLDCEKISWLNNLKHPWVLVILIAGFLQSIFWLFFKPHDNILTALLTILFVGYFEITLILIYLVWRMTRQ